MVLFHFSLLFHISLFFFLCVFLLVWLLLCFLHSFGSLSHAGRVFMNYVYVVLLFSLYKNLSSSSFLHNSRGKSFTALLLVMFWRCLLYILTPSLCMLCCIIGSHTLFFDLHIVLYLFLWVFQSPPRFLPIITLIVFNAFFVIDLEQSFPMWCAWPTSEARQYFGRVWAGRAPSGLL